MSIRALNIERENGDVAYIHFEIERRELRDIVGEITERLDALDSVETVKAIRKEKNNPVIKTGDNQKVYFKWDDGNARVNVTLASDEVTDSIVRYFRDKEPTPSDDDVPWDRDEMAEEARERIREKRDRGVDVDEDGRADRIDDEERQRVREAGNHRDERQREPRGGKERRGRNKASVEGEYTSFIPPYEKDEVSYHYEGEGDKPHLNCEDCVHYIEGGGCHMVQGEIDPEGYCEDLYADVGLFARVYDGEFEINLASWGEMFEDRFGRVSLENVGDRVKEAIRRKLK